jgi:uncharacterized caspase-like protein
VQAASSSKRLALIIGNSAYENFPVLDNPVNDAHAVKEKLNSLKFAVNDTIYEDQNHNEMLTSIEKFSGNVHEDTTDIVFYYSGHGCSIGMYSEKKKTSRFDKMSKLILVPTYPRNS